MQSFHSYGLLRVHIPSLLAMDINIMSGYTSFLSKMDYIGNISIPCSPIMVKLDTPVVVHHQEVGVSNGKYQLLLLVNTCTLDRLMIIVSDLFRKS